MTPVVLPAAKHIQEWLWKSAYLFGAGLVFIAIVANLSVDDAGSDREWLMYSAQMVLRGKTFFDDLFDTNPPLLAWIYALPIDIALHLGLKPAFPHLAAFCLVIIAFSLIVCLRVMAFHPEFKNNRKKQAEFALLFCFTVIFSINPEFFFLRDHLFIVLALPYMLRFMPSLADATFPRALRSVIGCMAAVAFCIKPHCLVFVIAVIFMYMLYQSSLRIIVSLENIIIYLGWSLYMLALWQFVPEYFTLVVPMLIATYYACNAKHMAMALAKRPFHLFVVTFIKYHPNWDSPYRRDIFYLVGLCAASIGYILLNNGWEYTYQPLIMLLVFTNGWVLWAALYVKNRLEANEYSSQQTIPCIALCAFAFAMNIYVVRDYDRDIFQHYCNLNCSQDKALVRILNDNHARSFGTITLGFTPWPYTRRISDTRWVTRFNNLWMMNRFFLEGDPAPAKDGWIPAYVAQKLAEDMDRNKPDIVFVENVRACSYSRNANVDLGEYFERYPAFKQALGHYDLAGSFDFMALPDDFMQDHYPTFMYDQIRFFNSNHPGQCLYDIYKRKR